MHTQTKKSLGFSALEAIIIIIIIAAVGIGGWWVWQRNHRGPNAHTPTVVTQVPPSVTWQTYKNEKAGLTFKYPSSWTSQSADTVPMDDGSFGGVGGTLTSPSGNKLTWIYQAVGGKGGECTPNLGDVPFADGNKCASKQVLSVQKLPSVAKPKNTEFNLFDDALYITHTKYQSEGESTPVTYQICLDPYFADRLPEVGTHMGFLLPCEYWSTGFNATFSVPNEAGFNSSDAKMAEQIMRTFNSLQE